MMLNLNTKGLAKGVGVGTFKEKENNILNLKAARNLQPSEEMRKATVTRMKVNLRESKVELERKVLAHAEA